MGEVAFCVRKNIHSYCTCRALANESEHHTFGLTCAESFPDEDAYLYHFANHHLNHSARTLAHIPLQQNYWTHWAVAYNSTVHYPVAARTNVNVERSWRGLGHAVAAAAAQTAWNWRYFVVHIVAACIVADYTVADHIAAADASWTCRAVAAAYDAAADIPDGVAAKDKKDGDDADRDVPAAH